ncbi:MAG: PilZ domain-containing protein [Candidatus Omnitrophica bacterium]|nr:PilZ domain-containing protein [Candidatus Omnitrophota bacterium]
MIHEAEGKERRQFIRIEKHFILRFYLKVNPALEFEISQIENISKGGLCFTSTLSFKKDDLVVVELRTPYLTNVVNFEGTIVAIQEKVKGMIYSNHLQFQNIDPAAATILEKIEKFSADKEVK